MKKVKEREESLEESKKVKEKEKSEGLDEEIHDRTGCLKVKRPTYI